MPRLILVSLSGMVETPRLPRPDPERGGAGEARVWLSLSDLSFRPTSRNPGKRAIERLLGAPG